MNVIIAGIVGFLAGRMLWIALKPTWSAGPFLRPNYQGVGIPTAAGVVIAFTLLVVEAIRMSLAAAGVGDPPGMTEVRMAAIAVVTGFAILGLLDDFTGTTGVRGFAGHMKALGRGELTSGALKLLVGAAVAIVGAGLMSPQNFGELVVDAAVIALMANLINLLDLRPGRASKTAIATFVVLAVVSGMNTALVPVAIVIGATAALVLDDLHARLMLGDTGSNVIGAALGLGIVSQVGTSGALVALVVLSALNLLSEVVSFSKIIEGFGPLRTLDNLGRKREQTVDIRDGGAKLSSFGPPIRATVGGAHEGSSGSQERSPRLVSSDEPSTEEDSATSGSTRSFGTRQFKFDTSDFDDLYRKYDNEDPPSRDL